MFLAYLIVAGGAVLQIITVAVLLEVVPFCRHLRRPDSMIVFRVQVVVVVLRVYLLYVRQEVVERLNVALFRQHRQPHFAQGVERLEARKDKGVVFESVAECFGYFMRQAVADGRFKHTHSFFDDSLRFGGCQLREVEASVFIDEFCRIERELRLVFRQRQQVMPV